MATQDLLPVAGELSGAGGVPGPGGLFGGAHGAHGTRGAAPSRHTARRGKDGTHSFPTELPAEGSGRIPGTGRAGNHQGCMRGRGDEAIGRWGDEAARRRSGEAMRRPKAASPVASQQVTARFVGYVPPRPGAAGPRALRYVLGRAVETTLDVKERRAREPALGVSPVAPRGAISKACPGSRRVQTALALLGLASHFLTLNPATRNPGASAAMTVRSGRVQITSDNVNPNRQSAENLGHPPPTIKHPRARTARRAQEYA